MDQTFDVVIIGAGPAGTSCALALRNSGLKIALIDKNHFPRNKICGDAIPGPSLKTLGKLLPNLEKELEHLKMKVLINSCSIFDFKSELIHLKWKSTAYNSSRTSFDNFLLELVKKFSNTKVYEGIAIKQITRNGKIKLVGNDNFTIQCEMVVGSDGANSVVSKTFDNLPDNKSKNCIAIRAYYENVEAPENSNLFFLLKKIPGYFWIFPLGNNIFNVGVGSINTEVDGNKIDLKKVLNEAIHNDPLISEKFKTSKIISNIEGFGLPLGGKERKISGDRYLLTGDAAHLIDPLQGHGIDKAMQSGVLASEQIQKCFEVNNFSDQFMSQYDAAIHKSIGKALKRNLFIMKLFYKLPILFRFIALFGKSDQIKNFLLKWFYKKPKQE